MDITYLKEFVVLAEIGNFQEAAESLYLSQPSLSRHIMVLEKVLGAAVFNRTTRKVELNEFGRYLLPYAKEITRQYEECTNGFSHMLKDASSLIIGSIPAMKQFNIIELIAIFKQKYPNCAIEVIEEGPNELIPLLKEGKCNLAFIREFNKPNDNLSNDIKRVLIAKDSIVAVIPAKHPLAGTAAITVDQLKNENILLLKGGLIHNKLLKACASAGFQPNVSFTAMRVESVIDMAGKGMGIAFVLRSSTRSLDNSVVVADIDPICDFDMDISLAYKKSGKMSLASKHFLQVVRQWINKDG